MRITKCDLCKKKINEQPVAVRIGLFSSVELCRKCGADILKFLTKHKLIKKEDGKSK